MDGHFPEFVGKITQLNITHSSVFLSLSDLEITFFLVVKITQSHVGNSNSTRKKKKEHYQELHCQVLVNIQPEGCLSSFNSC